MNSRQELSAGGRVPLDSGDKVVLGRCQGVKTVVRQAGCRKKSRAQVIAGVDDGIADGWGVVEYLDDGALEQIWKSRCRVGILRIDLCEQSIDTSQRGARITPLLRKPVLTAVSVALSSAG